MPNAGIPSDRTTKWDPGITTDDQLGLPLEADGLPSRSQICATLNPGQDIQTAINNCPASQVVKLNPGTFNVQATIQLNKGVVLRGSGSNGAPLGTTIVKMGGGTVIGIGPDRDSTCYGGTGINLVQDGVKESYTVSVGPYGITTVSAANNFTPGDLALIDLIDDSTVHQGDCTFYKRVSGRSVSQRVEIKAVDRATGIITLGSPLHWNFKSGGGYQAQIVRVLRPVTKWAGVESIKIQGGTNTSYNGAMAGGIDISNAAYCWVKDIQTGGTIGGMHVLMTGTYRCVVRDSYVHHSANYNYGADCYGIVLRCGSSENLIENNVVRWMNKPIQLSNSGGGNVIGYNYADNAWSDQDGTWQESPFDCHCSFPHMELIEGNFIPHMAAPVTHGNAGYLTFYRNYSSHQFAAPAVWGKNPYQTGAVAAIFLDPGDIGMTVVGNVLGAATSRTSPASSVYDSYNNGVVGIYKLGGPNDVSATTLYRNGNFDYFNKKVIWQGSAIILPPSLYLKAKPAWWPPGTAWPWVGPELSPMVNTLPAKARSDSRYNPSMP
jgi:hypothetical protein